MKKKLDMFGIIVLMLVIITFSVIIGANEKGLRIIPTTILFTLELIFLILKKIFNKKTIVIKNKIDIFVLLFFISTLFPLIFKTYSTFQGTVEFMIKYFFAYSSYLCVRNIDDKKKINYLFYTIIISSIIFFIFGIDMLYNRVFDKIYNYINLNYLNMKYLSGPFGYKNALAIYYLSCFYISIYLIKNTKKIPLKIILFIYLLFSLLCIILSSSRTVILLTIFSFIVYIFILYFKVLKKYIKKIIIILCSLIIIFLILFFVFCNKSDKFSIYNKKTFTINYKFKTNTNYELTFFSNTKDNYEINIEETSKNFIKINSKYIITPTEVSNDLYKYTLKYKTSNKPFRFKITFYGNKNVIINKFLVNNKEYILKYKYIPYKISYYISMLNIKDYSIYQRIIYYKDSIKIFKNSPLIGGGGDNWKVRSLEVQDIKYSVKETHSYFFELLISFGLIGLLLYTLMIIIFNKSLIKYIKKDITYLPLLFSIDLIILHSYTFDFDLSFMVVFILVYVLLGLLSDKIESKKYKYNNIIDNIILILLICLLSFLYIENIYRNNNFSLIDRNIKKEIVMKSKTNTKKEKLDKIKKYISNEPYFNQIVMQEYYIITFNDCYDDLNNNEILNYIKFYNTYKSNHKYKYRFNYDNSLYYTNISYNFYDNLINKNIKDKKIKNEISKLKDIIISESNENINIVNNSYDIDEERKNLLINSYEEILNNLK